MIASRYRVFLLCDISVLLYTAVVDGVHIMNILEVQWSLSFCIFLLVSQMSDNHRSNLSLISFENFVLNKLNLQHFNLIQRETSHGGERPKELIPGRETFWYLKAPSGRLYTPHFLIILTLLLQKLSCPNITLVVSLLRRTQLLQFAWLVNKFIVVILWVIWW